MRFSPLLLQFIEGRAFDKGLRMDLNAGSSVEFYRNKRLLDLSRGKRIIHFGFLDHLPLIEKKINRGEWLHKELMHITSRCVGLDIDTEGVRQLAEKYHIDDIYALDVFSQQLPVGILEDRFDMLLLPDVLEHIPNPVMFLSQLRKTFSGIADEMVVTVPNGFRYANIINSLRRVEVINSDHRFWFTPYTLWKVIAEGQLVLEDMEFVQHSRIPVHHAVKRLLTGLNPVLRDTLLARVSWKSVSNSGSGEPGDPNKVTPGRSSA